MDAGEPDTLKESTTRLNVIFWKISAISEVKIFMSRKEWIPINRRIVRSKCKKP